MRRIVSIRLENDLLAAARAGASRDGRTLTNFIERAVRREIGDPASGSPSRALRALRQLRSRQSDLAALGVIHVAIFGSVARGEDGPDSDVDVVLDTDPGKVRSLFAYGGLQQRLEEWLGERVDLVERRRLPTHIAEAAEREQLIAF